MKILVRILIGIAAVILLIVIAVFGMRFYNYQKYDMAGKAPDYHDYGKYPDSFEGGTIERFESGQASGFHLLPEDPVSSEPVAVFGGSEGSSNFDLAVQLAEEGHEVYSLFFFGAPNQTEELNQVPLEFFQDFLDYAELSGENVTVLGSSKGAELGLVLTDYYEEVNHLILYTPSSYVFQGLNFSGDTGSSWTWQEEDLPFIDLQQSNFMAFIRTMFDSIVLNPIKYRETYVSAVEMNDNSEEARIDTSNVSGNALLIAGGEDAMWQGEIAAEEIREALGDQAQLELYPKAGHLFGVPPVVGGLALGGTEEANDAAKEDSDQKLLEFLNENLGG